MMILWNESEPDGFYDTSLPKVSPTRRRLRQTSPAMDARCDQHGQ